MDYPLGDTMKHAAQLMLDVLIPILMDYPLGDNHKKIPHILQRVLIPILMDYPLGESFDSLLDSRESVLIPILMDYPLGATSLQSGEKLARSLNPYSNGLPSRGLATATTSCLIKWS